jgi:hypothetical protein
MDSPEWIGQGDVLWLAEQVQRKFAEANGIALTDGVEGQKR